MKNEKNQSDKLFLAVTLRNVFGRKLRKLRAQGSIPGNIYGPDFKSAAVSTNFKEFVKVYKVARETGIIYLKLDSQEIPVLIKNLQTHPVNDKILHIDFRKIDLQKKIQTEVPVKITGASDAVTQKGGVLLTLSESLLVEALPQDIPQKIEVDISAIKEIGQEIKVSDLLKSEKYEIKTPPVKVVVSVVAHKEESVTPETVAPPTEVISEEKAVEEEAAETAVPEEGKPAEPAGAGKQAPETKPASAKASTGKPELPKAEEKKK